MTPTAECFPLCLPPRKGGDDMTPTAECFPLCLPPRKGGDDKRTNVTGSSTERNKAVFYFFVPSLNPDANSFFIDIACLIPAAYSLQT